MTPNVVRALQWVLETIPPCLMVNEMILAKIGGLVRPPNFSENELLIIINNLGEAIHTPRSKNVKSVRGVPMVGCKKCDRGTQ